MATKPTKTAEMTPERSVRLMNAIRRTSGAAYAEGVPQIYLAGQTVDGKKISHHESLATLRAYGQAVLANSDFSNQFISALVNRIAKVEIFSRLYENPLKFCLQGLLEYGESLELTFVEMAKGYQFDPKDAETTLFKRYIPNVHSAIVKVNFRKYYPTSIEPQLLRGAFLSFDGLSKLEAHIHQQVTTGIEYDTYEITKYLMARAILRGEMKVVDVPNIDSVTSTPEDAKTFTKIAVTHALNMKFFNREYNYAGVNTYTDIDDLYTFVTPSVKASQDVEVLAAAFNEDYAKISGRQVLIDGFGMLDVPRLNDLFKEDVNGIYTPLTANDLKVLAQVGAVMVDKDYLQIYDNLMETRQVENGKGLYWTYFFHVWRLFAVNVFTNAVCLYEEGYPFVGQVTPGFVVKNGEAVLLEAEVVGTTNKGVTWGLEKGSINGVTLSGNSLTVDESCTEKVITLKITTTDGSHEYLRDINVI